MKNFVLFAASLVAAAGLLFLLQGGWGRFPAMGDLLDPRDGLYYNARTSKHAGEASMTVPGLESDVQVVRDERGVPHIFANNDLDAVTAMAYTVAHDRLFQLDFIPRVAAGTLSEILGPSMVATDRFLRQTGMEWGARKNLKRIMAQAGLEKDILQAYVRGVNAYLDTLQPKDLPFEFKLLGYEPDRFSDLDVVRVLQYMTFDLTYRSDDSVDRSLIEKLGADAYESLYPRYARLFVPIIPEPGGQLRPQDRRPLYTDAISESARNALAERHAFQKSLLGTPLEGFIPGKGSNNWAVGPEKSVTGAAILAGDMHLSLWLPSIWYEVHIATPAMNVYGVTIPGAPLPVEGFNDYVGWAYTNTGSDQIDHMALTLDASRRKYLFEGEYIPLLEVQDTIWVKGGSYVADTLRYARWGPVVTQGDGALALRWVAHDSSRTVIAQWGMNHARDFEEFQKALTYWDTPMQNVLYADVDGNIAIRSTGYLPIRGAGHGMGLLDGSTDMFEWTGRVPFDELPYSYNPDQHFLTSTNQQPADSTYPYYLGHDWEPGFRSLRIDALLRAKEKHSVEDFKRYQADVYVVQRDLFVALLDSLTELPERAAELRDLLSRWEGEADVDRPEPLVLDLFLKNLKSIVWDEPVFEELPEPGDESLLALLFGQIDGKWLDVTSTSEIEGSNDVVVLALNATVDSLESQFGWEKASWRWGKNHHIVFRHFTRSAALRALWRGPYEYPGFASTLSPARDRMTTHSASWRMVVDFSSQPPVGYGVYPGGQSGNPFSPFYDEHIERYLKFEHYPLLKPVDSSEFPADRISSLLQLSPKP